MTLFACIYKISNKVLSLMWRIEDKTNCLQNMKRFTMPIEQKLLIQVERKATEDLPAKNQKILKDNFQEKLAEL